MFKKKRSTEHPPLPKEYIWELEVEGNPRVFKALRNQFHAVLEELRRIEAGAGVDDELMDTIQMMAAIMDGMKEE